MNKQINKQTNKQTKKQTNLVHMYLSIKPGQGHRWNEKTKRGGGQRGWLKSMNGVISLLENYKF